MYFAQQDIASPQAGILHDGSTTRVLYSIHSGYDELRRFVRGLKVREVFPFNAPFRCACIYTDLDKCTHVGQDEPTRHPHPGQ